ncbi:MAG: hypothetical protein QOE36_930 [Gaiellaceae bacterium]|jgi:hypothetical protein|nr:hypothetical protein [Gaiellaceae bacterium]
MRFEVDRRRVVHETIDGEAILIQMETGYYYSLDGSGCDIWNLLAGGCGADEIASRLSARYEAPPEAIAAAVSALVEQLLEERLIGEAQAPSENGGPPAETDATSARAVFTAPVLHRYTDMADFMLVDPIHEVEESGWPNRKVAP